MKNRVIAFLICIFFISNGFVIASYDESSNTENVSSLGTSKSKYWYSFYFDGGGSCNVEFPEDIWLYNSNIKNEPTCENFCIDGGIWDKIQSIVGLSDGVIWEKNGEGNTLFEIEPNTEYTFAVSSSCTIYFKYDLLSNKDQGYLLAESLVAPEQHDQILDVEYSFSSVSQVSILESFGNNIPTSGDTFILMSTGVAGANPVTTKGENPGSEFGTDFPGGDFCSIKLYLKVPAFYHYVYFDIMYFSTDNPERVEGYTDKCYIWVDSQLKGSSEYMMDVNSGYYVWDSNGIPGTGFDIFTTDTNPNERGNAVTNTPKGTPEGGSTDLITIGGLNFPVMPNDIITVEFAIFDYGDDYQDSAVFLDNLDFAGYQENNPPQVPLEPYGEILGEKGVTYTYSTTTTRGTDNDLRRYGWDWDGDNVVDEWTGYYQPEEECIIEHKWDEYGTYHVQVIAEDEHGLQSLLFSPSLEVVISHINYPPSKPIVYGFTIGFIDYPSEFTFFSSDEDEDNISYEINWGDETTTYLNDCLQGVEQTTSHIWNIRGDYSISARAYDGESHSEWSDPLTITIIGNHPPDKPIIMIPSSAKIGEEVEYTMRSHDSDGDFFQFNISYGDGSMSFKGNCESDKDYISTHTWDSEGHYTMTVNAYDHISDSEKSETVIYIYENRPPEKPTITPLLPLVVNKDCWFDFKSLDPDHDKIKYHWSWGDGTGWFVSADEYLYGQSTHRKHNYDQIGEYYIEVYSEDTNGAKGPHAKYLACIRENQPPSEPYEGIYSDGKLNWKCDDPDKDKLTFDVYFEKGDATPDELVSEKQTNKSYSLGNLAKGMYYWQVVVFDEGGHSKTSPVWKFEIKEKIKNKHFYRYPILNLLQKLINLFPLFKRLTIT